MMAQSTNQFVSYQVNQQRTGNPSELSEVQALRQELADTQKKLQGYADAAISLYNELRALRESICNACKEKFVPNMAAAQPLQVAGAVRSSSSSRGEKAAEPTNFWRRMLKSKQRPVRNSSPDRFGSAMSNVSTITVSAETSDSPDHPESARISLRPTHIPVAIPSTKEKSVTVSGPLPKSSSRASTPQASAPRWSVRRDATANAALNVTFVRSFIQKGWVMSVKFSADGRYLATALGGNSGSVAIFDVATGKKIGAVVEYASQYSSGPRPGMMCVRFSPDSRLLAIADMNARVLVWDIPNKRMRNVFTGHGSEIHSVDFSPNGRLVVSACCDMTVRIWNMRDGSAKVFSDNAQEFLSVRFSPNGQYIAAGNYDGVLRIWNVRTGCLVKRWADQEGYIRGLVFTADGRGLLSGRLSGGVNRWDVSSLGMVRSGGEPVGKEVKYNGHKGAVWCAVDSPDTRWVVSASEDTTAILWDANSATRQCTLLGHEDHIYSTDFSPAGTYLATGSRDGSTALWKYNST